MQAWDAFDRLPRITATTLVLHEDRVIAPANAEFLAVRDFIARRRDA